MYWCCIQRETYLFHFRLLSTAVAVPSELPLQLALSMVIDPIANTSGSLTVTVSVSVQLFASVIVTLYIPAVKLVAVSVVCAVGSSHK